MKIVHGNYYVHIDWLHDLPAICRKLVREAMELLPDDFEWNIVRVNPKSKKVTFAWYPNFDEDAHPELKEWIKIDLENKTMKRRIEKGKNPPILHRKETFVNKRDKRYKTFAYLTAKEVEAGLYNPKFLHKIGRKKFWTSLLLAKGVRIVDHELVMSGEIKEKGPQIAQSTLIDFAFTPSTDTACSLSAKTAIHRRSPSLPLRIALRLGLLKGNVFDWGCGYGRDVEYLRELGITAEGWDPIHKPKPKPEEYPSGLFQTVLCIYVINTLPTLEDRLSVLKDIYNFLPPGGQLLLAARSAIEVEKTRTKKWKQYGDGWVTSRGTFQKGFTIEELLDIVNYVSFKARIISKAPPILLCQKEV